MKLSEITFIQWMGAVLVVNGAVLGYSNEVADLFGPIWQKHIFSVMTIGSAIVGGFITIFGGIGTQARNVVAAGGQVNVSPLAATALTTLAQDVGEPAIKSTGTIVKAIIAAFALSFLLIPGSAQAQFKTPQQIAADVKHAINPAAAPSAGTAATNTLAGVNFTTIGQKLQTIAKEVIDKGIADLSAASTDAVNHNDKIAQPCWDAQVAFLKQLPSEWQTPPTDIGPALAIQISRDLLNTITGNDVTSLKVACAALIGDQITIINQTLSIIGVAGIAGLPAGL